MPCRAIPPVNRKMTVRRGGEGVGATVHGGDTDALRDGLGGEGLQERSSNWHAEPGAAVPTNTSRVAERRSRGHVVALGDVPQQAGILVDLRKEEADGARRSLINQRRQPGPERRDRTRAAERCGLAMQDDLVSAARIGVARHVGDSAPWLTRAEIDG